MSSLDGMKTDNTFLSSTGEAHWLPLLRARAIECECYVIAAAQYVEGSSICETARTRSSLVTRIKG